MTTIDDTLEQLFEKVRHLPEDRKRCAIILMEEIIADEEYVLSAEELAILGPALEGASRGELASDEEVAEALYKPWA